MGKEYRVQMRASFYTIFKKKFEQFGEDFKINFKNALFPMEAELIDELQREVNNLLSEMLANDIKSSANI